MQKKGIIVLIILFYPLRFLFAQSDYLVSKAVQCWHSVLANELNVSNSQLLLCQGDMQLGSSSTWLWTILNSVVVNTDSIYYYPVQLNTLSGNYNRILFNAKTSPVIDTACNLATAIVNFANANGVFVWNKTMDDLQAALAASPPLQFTVDTTLTGWVDSTTGNITVHITIAASFNHVVNFISYPYAPNNINWQLQQYAPWFMPCIFNKAYYNAGGNFLPATDWNAIFGPNGSLQRICYALIVVQGENITLTASGGGSTYTTTITATAPFVIGVLVATVPEYIRQGQ